VVVLAAAVGFLHILGLLVHRSLGFVGLKI